MEASKNLTFYYALTLYTLKVASYCAEMARDFANHPKVKHNLVMTRSSVECKIRDLMHILRDDSRDEMIEDLASEDLQALASILMELIDSPGIEPIENEVVKFIREKKKQLHELEQKEVDRVAAVGKD